MATRLKTWLLRSLRSLVDQPVDALVEARYEKFRRMGVFLEEAAS
jgi:acetyl-CoA carboxylase carboxyl transferase subunit alpha